MSSSLSQSAFHPAEEDALESLRFRFRGCDVVDVSDGIELLSSPPPASGFHPSDELADELVDLSRFFGDDDGEDEDEDSLLPYAIIPS